MSSENMASCEKVVLPFAAIAMASGSDDDPIFLESPIIMSSENMASCEKVVLPFEAIAMASGSDAEPTFPASGT